jgi:hypothetical protein
MSRAICPKCGNTDVSWIRDDADYAQYICLECKQGFYYPPKTVFDLITASPEVLAPLLVWQDYDWCVFRSAVINGGEFNYKEEAIAATVKKLKEVEK